VFPGSVAKSQSDPDWAAEGPTSSESASTGPGNALAGSSQQKENRWMQKAGMETLPD